jgi:hypothetical protein
MNIFRQLFLEERGTMNVVYKGKKFENVPCKVKGGVWEVFLDDKWLSLNTDKTLNLDMASFKFQSSDIAAISNRGKDVFSKVSIQWLGYIQESQQIKIKHALNGGEKLIILEGKKFKVDGYCEETNTLYE